MLPIEWTKDNRFRVPKGISAEKPIRKPAGTPSKDGSQLSDNFSGPELGLQWQAFKKLPSEMVNLNGGKLEFQAKGNSFANSSPLLVDAGDRKYEIEVEYTIDPNVTAGLTLFYNEQANMRIAVDAKQFAVFNQGNRKISEANKLGNHGYLRILNDENEISFYYSADRKSWNRIERTIDATGFNHNVFGGFMSLRAGLFAFGSGKVQFDNFIYHKL
jgi:beta-xylosidase